MSLPAVASGDAQTTLTPQVGDNTAVPPPKFDTTTLPRVREQYEGALRQHEIMLLALDGQGAHPHHPIRTRIRGEADTLGSRADHFATGGRDAVCITCTNPLPAELLAHDHSQLLRCGVCHPMHIKDLQTLGLIRRG